VREPPGSEEHVKRQSMLRFHLSRCANGKLWPVPPPLPARSMLGVLQRVERQALPKPVLQRTGISGLSNRQESTQAGTTKFQPRGPQKYWKLPFPGQTMIGNFHPELPFPANLFAPCTNQALAKDVRRDSLSEAVEGSI
jgi:hypothetical protein